MVGYLLRCRGRATLLDSVGGEGLAETGRGSIGEELGSGRGGRSSMLDLFSREGLDTGEGGVATGFRESVEDFGLGGGSGGGESATGCVAVSGVCWVESCDDLTGRGGGTLSGRV